jgi:hypothetical protein
MKVRTIIIVVGTIALTVLSRLLPHPPNFTPVTALALFGAATLADRRLALLLPLVALGLSDICKEMEYHYGLSRDHGFYSGMWTVYLAFVLVTLLGFGLRRRRNVFTIGVATVSGSLLFFLVTNFAVWAGGDGSGPFDYPHTFAGLTYCYYMALPFLGRSLLGDASYAFVLFGSWALAERWVSALRHAPVES